MKARRSLFKAASLPALILTLVLFQAACQEPAESQPEANENPWLDSSTSAAECEAGLPAAEAFLPSGYYENVDGDTVEPWAIISNGQKVTPAGSTVNLQRFAWGLAISPDNERAYVLNGGGGSYLEAFDISQDPPVKIQSIVLNNDHGVVLSSDGGVLYVGGGADAKVYVFSVTRSAEREDELAQIDAIELPSWAGALALSSDDQTLYITSPAVGKLFKASLTGRAIDEVHVGHTPYDVLLSADDGTAYVSNWGGAEVAVVDTAGMTVSSKVEVEKNPEGMAFAENDAYLLVTNSDADSISVIDLATDSVTQSIDLDTENPELKAWTPNHVAVHPGADTHRAYVASADHNAIDVIDTSSWEVIGSIPAAWYPVRVEMNGEGDKILVVNAKGWGSKQPESTHKDPFGVLQVIDTPANAQELEIHTRVVKANTDRPLGFFPDSTCENQIPLPLNDEEKSVIEHVILVVKENKTYDEILGDLMGPEGDEWHAPAYAVNNGMDVALRNGAEPEERSDVTPNAHSLALTFIDFVNFYGDAEVSLQGHMWTTQADCNDFVEKTRFDRPPATGVEPTTKHYNRSIFQHLFDHGLNFRVYGEPVNFALDELEIWRDKIDMKYPYWTNGVTDLDKAARIIHEWELAEQTGEESLFPSFIYIVLPNDHAQGGKAGAPSVQSHVADNDAGLGMLVDWLSHSSFWDKSILFAIEDDPQSGVGDHIDAHRSVCFAASPWIKRGYMSTVHYSIPSLYRTIELILGVPPMNRNTLLAPPMIDIFTDTADSTVYDAIPMQFEPWNNPETGRFAEEAKQWDWSTFDGHKGYGDHVWRLLNGDAPRPEGSKRIED